MEEQPLGLAAQKSLIGTPELHLLIEQDTKDTMFVPVAEINHAIWCIASATGLRPSSFGPDKSRNELEFPFVAWQDLQFTRIRTLKTGHFLVEITIRYIMGNKQKAEVNRATKNLVFEVSSPSKAANLLLSVPHRLLVIALRRGVLEGISTVKELVDGQQMHIKIKEEFKETPLFLKAVDTRTTMKKDVALPASSLSRY